MFLFGRSLKQIYCFRQRLHHWKTFHVKLNNIDLIIQFFASVRHTSGNHITLEKIYQKTHCSMCFQRFKQRVEQKKTIHKKECALNITALFYLKYQKWYQILIIFLMSPYLKLKLVRQRLARSGQITSETVHPKSKKWTHLIQAINFSCLSYIN